MDYEDVILGDNDPRLLARLRCDLPVGQFAAAGSHIEILYSRAQVEGQGQGAKF